MRLTIVWHRGLGMPVARDSGMTHNTPAAAIEASTAASVAGQVADLANHAMKNSTNSGATKGFRCDRPDPEGSPTPPDTSACLAAWRTATVRPSTNSCVAPPSRKSSVFSVRPASDVAVPPSRRVASLPHGGERHAGAKRRPGVDRRPAERRFHSRHPPPHPIGRAWHPVGRAPRLR